MKVKKIVAASLMIGLVVCLFSLTNAFAGKVYVINNSDETISVRTSVSGDNHIIYANKGERVTENQFIVQAVTLISVAKQPNAQKGTPFTPLTTYTPNNPHIMKDYEVTISAPAGTASDVQIKVINKWNLP